MNTFAVIGKIDGFLQKVRSRFSDMETQTSDTTFLNSFPALHKTPLTDEDYTVGIHALF